MGLEQNMEEAIKYTEKAAEGGDLISRHNVGCANGENGNPIAAMRHMRLSASGGYKLSMTNLIACFERGMLHHGDLAETMQSFYRARDELKSDVRDKYLAYLKMVGEYEEKHA
jgi:TPR repeat protein